MIDPFIFRSTPERYAREEDLREKLTPEEREVVQDEIVRQWQKKRDAEVVSKLKPKRVPPQHAMFDGFRLWKSK